MSTFDLLAKSSLIGVYFFFPISLALGNIFIALTLLFWVLAGQYKKRWTDISDHPLTYPALGMFALVLLGTLYSKAPTLLALESVGKYTKFLFIPLTLSLLTQPVWIDRSKNAFMAAMFITLVSTYAGIWVAVPWSVTKANIGWGMDHTVFKDHIAQGLLMATFTLMTLGLFLSSKQWSWKRIFWGTTTTLSCFSILFLSQGRLGYAGLLAGMGVFGWTFYRRPTHKTAFVISLMVLIPVLLVSSPVLQSRVEQGYVEAVTALNNPVNDEDSKITSIGARIDMWRLSVKSIGEHPLFGTGTGSYPTVVRETIHSPGVLDVIGVHPHNQFLFFGVELGLIGMLGYIFYIYKATASGNFMTITDRAVLFGFLAIMISSNLFNSSLWISTENHLFTFMLAAFTIIKKQDSST